MRFYFVSCVTNSTLKRASATTSPKAMTRSWLMVVHAFIGYLKFLFSPHRARSPVKNLSGGEQNRLFGRLFTRSANVLILDEPTNDLMLRPWNFSNRSSSSSKDPTTRQSRP